MRNQLLLGGLPSQKKAPLLNTGLSNKQEHVNLSDALTIGTLSLSGMNISTLDALDQRYYDLLNDIISAKAELDLSHNMIKTLSGMSQFSSLPIMTLNLSHNKMTQLNDLQHLKNFTNLLTLNIEANYFQESELNI